jgi:hypothetical protein
MRRVIRGMSLSAAMLLCLLYAAAQSGGYDLSW